jgi:general secretion pathway protein L
MKQQPALASAFERAETVWTGLADSLCELIDPFLQRFYPQRRLVAVVTAEDELEFFSVVNQTIEPVDPLGQAGLAPQSAWSSIELRLRPDQVLQRTLSLPVASRDFLGPIIEHRLERLTPWRPEDVLYGFRALPGAGQGATISVHFAATSSGIAAGPLAALRDAGFTPGAMGPAPDKVSEPLEIDFYRRSHILPRAAIRQNLSRIWFAGAALLCLALTLSSVWRSSAEGSREASEAHLLKSRRLLKLASEGAISGRERVLIEGKRPEKSIVVLIDKLSNVIPAGTYLRELAITPGKVRLTGISGDATALIGLLDKSGLFDVRFTAPVTREKDRTDNFEITAGRSPAPSPEVP